MPGPLEAAGVAHEATEYAPLTMDRYITGLWTQRSPLRDAAVPYLYGKFYSASRFDSLIDGCNREITARLTFKRRPGLSPFNTANVPGGRVLSFYSYKYIQDGFQVVKVLADTPNGVYDVSPPNAMKLLFTKSSGAGRNRFLGVGNQLFICNGVDSKKLAAPPQNWQANTAYKAGDQIVDLNGNLQFIRSNASISVNINSVQVLYQNFRYFLVVTWAASKAPAWADGTSVTFGGLTGFTQLNEQSLSYSSTLAAQYGVTLNAQQSCFAYYGPTYPLTGDAGAGNGNVSNGGTSGASQPTLWNNVPGGTTTDASIIWTCGGPALTDWSIPAPVSPPMVIADNQQMSYWQPGTEYNQYQTIIDSNGNYEWESGGTGGPAGYSGLSQPIWNTSLGGSAADNQLFWRNAGSPGGWSASSVYQQYSIILDSKQNLQIAMGGGLPLTSGTTEPNWATALGAQTSDGSIGWSCLGPGVVLVSGSLQYAYSYHLLDGTVTNASPITTIPNGVLGTQGGFEFQISGQIPANGSQIDQIWLWRTDQGGSTLVLRAIIPNPSMNGAGAWTYYDTDPTSAALNPLIIAPIAGASYAGDPPPAGSTAPAYHLQRVWMVNGSKVLWSGGPDTVTGNGSTAFPPQNSIQFPETITRLVSSVTNDAALMVFGTANVYAILGQGTASSPFYPVVYMPTVGLMNYDALTLVGSTFYLYTNRQKLASLDPSAGYVEIGFPIGDQFDNMTTAGQTGQMFNPLDVYVTWHESTSADSGLFVADSNVGWFRYSPVSSPESGFLWSPFAIVANGTSAVQSVETSTGSYQLLVGASGRGSDLILARDLTVFADNGTPYASSYGTLGNVVLCQSGEVAEVAHVALVSLSIGDRPTVGLLYDEIAETADIKFDSLQYTSVDPPTLAQSETLLSDRYVSLQDGETPKCMHCQLKITWPVQSVGDELLMHAIYGAKYGERRETPG